MSCRRRGWNTTVGNRVKCRGWIDTTLSWSNAADHQRDSIDLWHSSSYFICQKRRRATRKTEAHHTLVAHYITIVNMRIKHTTHISTYKHWHWSWSKSSGEIKRLTRKVLVLSRSKSDYCCNGVRTKNNFGIFLCHWPSTFQRVTWRDLTTPSQGAVHISLTTTCHNPHTGCFKKRSLPKTFWNIFTSVKSFCVKFCKFVGNSYPHVAYLPIFVDLS